jgi:hypothetical protein
MIGILVTALLIALPAIAKACDITVSVDELKKEVYKAGDIVVVKIIVVLKHRNCDVDINETSVKVSGSQITASTKWVNTEGKTWERKIKVKIVADKSGKAMIVVERTCDRDGGKGSLILTTES